MNNEKVPAYNNRSVMRQFLSLPVVLGTLLLLTGAAGIVINWRSTRDLYKLNDTAMQPTVAFAELSGFLSLLEQDLLREMHTPVGSADQIKYRKSARSLVNKITKRVKLQIDGSKGRPFESYLLTWVGDWEKFKSELETDLDTSNARSKKRASLDARVADLVDRMTNVNQYIQTDTKDMLADSTRFAQKAAYILIGTLLAGLIIGVFSSVLIVGGLRRLFLIITGLLSELEVANDKLSMMTKVDEMTGLFNFRHFKRQLEAEHSRSLRYGGNYSIIFFDIDNFKHYNDRNGHPAGDALLRRLAGLLQSMCRATDLPARYGGEEFAILCPEVDWQGATTLADRIRLAIETHDFDFASFQPLGKVSVSVGVSSFPEDGQTFDDVLKASDEAMYYAKKNGKNRVVSHDFLKSLPKR